MQILRISPRIIPRKRTQLGIAFHATNSRNAIRNHYVEEKPTQNKMRQPNISIMVSEKTTFDVQTNHFVKLFCCCFVKLIFLLRTPFHSAFHSKLRNWLFRGIRNASECLRMSAFFRGIIKPFRVYSAEFFRNEIPFPTLHTARLYMN
jgi:hypothetical protein